MPLYETLASRYDELFPFSRDSLDFLETVAGSPAQPGRALRLIDAGCATGALVLAFAERGWEALGIEPEPAMVAIARAAASRRGLGSARFVIGDMLESASLVGSAAPADLVLCLGNTLPHLSPDASRRFLSIARSLLAPSGSLVLQLVNYAKQGMGPGFIFPDIRAGGYCFRRRYDAAAEGRGSEGRLRFIVELEDLAAGRTIHEELVLFSHSPSWIRKSLEEAGFAPPRLSNGWAGGPFDEGRDTYLIVAAAPLRE